jgi:hypothetical protein
MMMLKMMMVVMMMMMMMMMILHCLLATETDYMDCLVEVTGIHLDNNNSSRDNGFS